MVAYRMQNYTFFLNYTIYNMKFAMFSDFLA